MKSLFAAAAAAALLAFAVPGQAQMAQPMQPGPMQTQPGYVPSSAPWMEDDRSSSDYPIPMQGDVSGDRLNAQYRGGIDVPPPNGLPAPYFVPAR